MGRIEGVTECAKMVKEEVAKIKAEREKFTVDDVIIKPEIKDYDSSDWLKQKDKHSFGEAYNMLRPIPMDDETANLD